MPPRLFKGITRPLPLAGSGPSVSAEFLHHLDDLVRVVGLVERPAPGHWVRGGWREAGGVDDRQVRIVLAAAFRDLPPVNLSGQPYVGDQHVGGMPCAAAPNFDPFRLPTLTPARCCNSKWIQALTACQVGSMLGSDAYSMIVFVVMARQSA